MKGEQNRSTAVMARRHDRDDVLNYFPTQPWATRALCEFLKTHFLLSTHSVWEPACGEGHMSEPLSEYFLECVATDVADYSEAYPNQHSVCDFLIEWDVYPQDIDWIITNPPFVLAQEFIEMMFNRMKVGCAVLVRTQFLEGMERHRELFFINPPTYILQFAERVPLVKGRLDKSASTATAYCWVIWIAPSVIETHPNIYGKDTIFKWISPCRRKLEKPGDYPQYERDRLPVPLFEKIGEQS